MRTALRSARAEAARLARDPGASLILVGAIFLYSFFYPIPYTPQVLREVPVVVVDLDRTSLSRQLVRTADAHPLLRVAGRETSLAEAERHVTRGDAGCVLLIPDGFERAIDAGRKARVGVFADASAFLVYRQVATGLLEVVGTLSAGIEVRRLEARGRPEASALAVRQPVPLLSRPLFNPAEGYGSYVVPGVLVLILQQTLLIGIGLLGGTEREQSARSSTRSCEAPDSAAVDAPHDSPQAPVTGGPNAPCAVDAAQRDAGTAAAAPGLSVAAPRARPHEVTAEARPLERVLGRALFYVTLYSFYCVFLFAVVHRVFGYPQRARALDLAAFALPFLLACTFLALALSTLFRRRETALQVLLFTSLPAVFLAGFAWPVEALPRWLRLASLLLPSTAGVDGFQRLTTMGAALRHVRFEWLLLWALALGYFALAWLAERRVRRAWHAAPRHVGLEVLRPAAALASGVSRRSMKDLVRRSTHRRAPTHARQPGLRGE